MMSCMPPMPGNGINITVSIDLGSMLGGPCPPPKPPYDGNDEKLIYFNEANRPKPKGGFGGAMCNVADKAWFDKNKTRFDDDKEDKPNPFANKDDDNDKDEDKYRE